MNCDESIETSPKTRKVQTSCIVFLSSIYILSYKMVNINFSGLEIDQHSIVFVWSQYDGVNIVPDNEQSDISGPGSKV